MAPDVAATEGGAAPAVSVLMPVYNGERWLPQAIGSVLAQTFEDFELVVVDDGSTDGSAAVVESFAERDARVRLVRAPHDGEPAARAVSLAEARSSLVAFLDADDEWLPNRLERQLPYADERTVVFADSYVADEDRRTERRYSDDFARAPDLRYPAEGLFPHLLVRGSFIMIGTVLAPRELVLAADSFRYADLHGFQSNEVCDWEMWLLLALHGARFHYLDEPLAVYRRHPDQQTALVVYEQQATWDRPPNPTAADWSRLLGWMIAVLDGLMPEVRGEDRRLLRRARRQWRKMLEGECRLLGWRQIVAGQTGAARRELLRSLRACPYSPRAWVALSLTLCPPLARRLVSGRV